MSLKEGSDRGLEPVRLSRARRGARSPGATPLFAAPSSPRSPSSPGRTGRATAGPARSTSTTSSSRSAWRARMVRVGHAQLPLPREEPRRLADEPPVAAAARRASRRSARRSRSTSTASRSGSRRRSTSGCSGRASTAPRGATQVALRRGALSAALPATMDLLYQNTGWRQFGYRFSNDYAVLLFVLLAVGARPMRGSSRQRPPGASRGTSSAPSRSTRRASTASISATDRRRSSTSPTEPLVQSRRTMKTWLQRCSWVSRSPPCSGCRPGAAATRRRHRASPWPSLSVTSKSLRQRRRNPGRLLVRRRRQVAAAHLERAARGNEVARHHRRRSGFAHRRLHPLARVRHPADDGVAPRGGRHGDAGRRRGHELVRTRGLRGPLPAAAGDAPLLLPRFRARRAARRETRCDTRRGQRGDDPPRPRRGLSDGDIRALTTRHRALVPGGAPRHPCVSEERYHRPPRVPTSRRPRHAHDPAALHFRRRSRGSLRTGRRAGRHAASRRRPGAPPIDRTWLYNDDARVAAPLTVLGMSSLSYTNVGNSPSRIVTAFPGCSAPCNSYNSFAGNTATPGGMLQIGGEVGLAAAPLGHGGRAGRRRRLGQRAQPERRCPRRASASRCSRPSGRTCTSR